MPLNVRAHPRSRAEPRRGAATPRPNRAKPTGVLSNDTVDDALIAAAVSQPGEAHRRRRN